MAALNVIDVSQWQGAIDWQKVQSRVDAVILRCGYGSDDPAQDDKQWRRNVTRCEALGIPYGVYLYSYADSKAKIDSEIKHVLRLLNGHMPAFPVFIDLEEHACGKYAKTAARTFVKAIKAAGYKAGVYTYESYYNSYLTGYSAPNLWVAKYSANRPSIGGVPYIAWQYTSSAQYAGITGRVDLSYFFKDFREKKKPGKTDPAQDATPTGSTLKLVEQVMLGKYGNGADRKKNLGSRYMEVQDMIDHIFESDDETLARETAGGRYGNGDQRRHILGGRYENVQRIIDGWWRDGDKF